MVDMSGNMTFSEFTQVRTFCRQFLSTLQPSLAFNGSHFSVCGYGSLGVSYLVNFTQCYSLSSCLAAVDSMQLLALGSGNVEVALSRAQSELSFYRSIAVTTAHQVLVLLARGGSQQLSTYATALAAELKFDGVEIIVNAISASVETSVQSSLLTLASEPLASHSFISFSFADASQLTYQMQSTFHRGT